MSSLSALVHELENKIPFSEKINTKISQAPAGWHIQHSLLVGLQIIQSVERSDPADYQYKFNLPKFLVYTLNKIPRGKAKAPERVIPKEAFNTDALKQDIQLLKNRLAVLDTLQPHNFIIHPIFGHLHLKATIKMLKLHTKHHIDIINDIIRS
jgi:hypothetical protein